MRGNVDRLLARVQRWRRYRQTVSELSDLTNRELDDLGIARGEIRYVARQSAR